MKKARKIFTVIPAETPPLLSMSTVIQSVENLLPSLASASLNLLSWAKFLTQPLKSQ